MFHFQKFEILGFKFSKMLWFSESVSTISGAPKSTKQLTFSEPLTWSGYCAKSLPCVDAGQPREAEITLHPCTPRGAETMCPRSQRQEAAVRTEVMCPTTMPY